MIDQTANWSNNLPTVAIIIIVVFIIHFIPTFVAFSREHASRKLILLLNILMGWTVIGWVVLLYWAAKGQKSGILG